MERIPASERTRENLKALMRGRSEIADGRSELVRLAARLIIEEALEGEARDALGRDYYARGAAPGAGYRNGYRTGRVKRAEGAIEYSAPQIADRSEPFRSRLREIVGGRTEALEALAVEMYARGLSTRDIEAAVHRRDRQATAEPHRSQRDHRAAVGGVRGVCQPRSVGVRGPLPVRRRHCRAAAPGPAARGGAGGLGHPGRRQEGAAASGAGHQGGHGELQGVLPGPAPARPARPAAGGQRRGARHHPRDRGVLPARAAPALPGAQDAQSRRARCPKTSGPSSRPVLPPATRRPRRRWRGSCSDDIVATYGRDLPSAVACLEDDFEACIAHLRFPLGHRRAIRTTNLLERLFGEERRRTKVIPHAFGERAVLKLMYAALIRAAERWRGIRIGEFEQRQLRAIREELDKDFAARNAPAMAPTLTPSPTRLSSKDRT